MIHPDTILREVDDTIGVGVFATRRIPRGTITWAADPWDRRVPHDQIGGLHPVQRAMLDRYAWREADEWIFCWDIARFVNHSCEPTCLGIDVGFEIAVRDIEEGEQLTDDYRSLGEFEQPFVCACGTPSCAGRVAPTDVAMLRARWTQQFQDGVQDLGAVAQPLLSWVREHDLTKLGLIGTPTRPGGLRVA